MILSSALYSSTETKIVVASYIDLVLVCIVIAVSFHALIPLVLPIHGSSVSVHSLYVFLPSTTSQCKEEHCPICVYSAYVILFPLRSSLAFPFLCSLFLPCVPNSFCSLVHHNLPFPLLLCNFGFFPSHAFHTLVVHET